MLTHKSKRQKILGGGLVNTLINKLPFEVHIPGYKFCGPGTKLTKRLARGDRGINKLDEACKEHDIAYNSEKDLSKRHEADSNLAKAAELRLYSKDASLGEKAAALGVVGAMKAKVKLGMGCRSVIRGTGAKSGKVKKRKQNKTSNVKSIIKTAKDALKNVKRGNLIDAVNIAMKAVKKSKLGKHIKATRIILIPKKGGILPLIPIFAGLSALGALAGGAAGVAKAVSDVKNAKEQLTENQRHNRAMEDIAIGKGMYIKPYKKGYGLFLAHTKYHKKYR